jgi:hypothetical protein
VKEGAYVFITGRQKELDEAVKAIGANVSGVQGVVAQLADLDRLYETSSHWHEFCVDIRKGETDSYLRQDLDQRNVLDVLHRAGKRADFTPFAAFASLCFERRGCPTI